MENKHVPPTFDELFMRTVYLTATKSKDPSTKVGAVLVRDNRIISTGYNGFPVGIDDGPARYEFRQLKYKYIVHAEHNSILAAARFGISTQGTTLYTNGIPCHDCMKAVIQSGIVEIVVHSGWPKMVHSHWESSTDSSNVLLEESKIKIREFSMYLDCDAYLDGKKIKV